MTQAPTPPELEHLATVEVKIGPPHEVGQAPFGNRRVIPILSGTVRGRINGCVLPGGADYQSIRSDTFTEIHARYVIETDEGDRIYVENTGIRVANPEDTAALVRGESVDPSRIYFRTAPRLETASPAWQWLNHHLLVGTGARYPDRVELNFYIVR